MRYVLHCVLDVQARIAVYDGFKEKKVCKIFIHADYKQNNTNITFLDHEIIWNVAPVGINLRRPNACDGASPV